MKYIYDWTKKNLKGRGGGSSRGQALRFLLFLCALLSSLSADLFGQLSPLFPSPTRKQLKKTISFKLEIKDSANYIACIPFLFFFFLSKQTKFHFKIIKSKLLTGSYIIQQSVRRFLNQYSQRYYCSLPCSFTSTTNSLIS